MRALRHAALLLALCVTTAVPARAAEPWTVADSEAAISAHSALAGCIADIETGHTLDPWSVGAQGELGLVQLHPRGLLPLYERWSDGASPFDPYTSMAFLDWALDNGYGPQWAGWWWCA
jgi:hypothetical protein